MSRHRSAVRSRLLAGVQSALAAPARCAGRAPGGCPTSGSIQLGLARRRRRRCRCWRRRAATDDRNCGSRPGSGLSAPTPPPSVIKRVVRRSRPHDPRIAVNVSTPSKLSFPSAHATSTTAAAILLGRAVGAAGCTRRLLVPPMLLSRLVLGVHYPTDVVGGAVIGAACAAAVTAGERLTRTQNRGVQ